VTQSFQANFRKNLAVLGRRHGTVLAKAVADAAGGFKMRVDPGHNPPVVALELDGEEMILNDGPYEEMVRRTLRELEGSLRLGSAILFNGLGNGLYLDIVFENQPALLLGMLNPLYVLEQRLEVLVANLFLRDWRRLIEAENVYFFAGPNCLDQFAEFLRQRSSKLLPVHMVRSSTPTQGDVTAVVEGLGQERKDRYEKLVQQIGQYYSRIPPQRYAQLFGAHPPRRPRVYLITTIFSTVLQYSTRDAADAFEQLGWETFIDIEEDRTDRSTGSTLAEKVWDFKPDLVFQIDHVRREWPKGVFPASLPYITWIQDRMPDLYCHGAGRRLGLTDLIFTISPICDLTLNYDYPEKQAFYFPMVANRRRLAGAAGSDPARQIVFVSHASQTTDQLFAEFDAMFGKTLGEEDHPVVRGAIAELVEDMRRRFAEGEFVLIKLQWEQRLVDALRSRGIDLDMVPQLRPTIGDFVFTKFGNGIYRHQILEWAAESGYPLKLYGRGWERHPTLGRYACGVIENGPPLAELYRNSAVALQAVITGNGHPRLFEGVAAGGFFLFPRHPNDDSAVVMGDMLEWFGRQSGRRFDDVLASSELDEVQRLALSHLRGTVFRAFDRVDDDIIRAAGILTQTGHWLSAFLGESIREVYYTTREQFHERLAWFFEHPEDRARILAQMQEHLARWDLPMVLGARLREISGYLSQLPPLDSGPVGSSPGGDRDQSDGLSHTSSRCSGGACGQSRRTARTGPDR